MCTLDDFDTGELIKEIKIRYQPHAILELLEDILLEEHAPVELLHALRVWNETQVLTKDDLKKWKEFAGVK